jgi:hypothetical protein
MNEINEQYRLNSAVLFLIFNRLDVTKIVFEAIRQAKPPRLYIASDGPRTTREDESEKVINIRDYVLHNIDWDCEVETLFRNENLGCKIAVSSAISWFFHHEERGIILEDDCLPDHSFFRFCEEMLHKYSDDERIGMISGDNFQFGSNQVKESYYFSRYPHIWGWATWKRAWEKYDVDIKNWPEFKKNHLRSLNFPKRENSFWSKVFKGVFNKKIDTWDYQWVFAMWINGMLTVIPSVNLISNIGFGVDATHTKGISIYSNMKTSKLKFPLIHPKFFLANSHFDANVSKSMFNLSVYSRLLLKAKAIMGKLKAI